MFRTVPLPIIRSSLTYTWHWYMSYGLKTASEQGRDGPIPALLGSCLQNSMAYTVPSVQLMNS